MCLAGLAPRRVDYCKEGIVSSQNSDTVEQRESIEEERTVLNLGHCDGFVVKTEEREIWSTFGVGCLKVDRSEKKSCKNLAVQLQAEMCSTVHGPARVRRLRRWFFRKVHFSGSRWAAWTVRRPVRLHPPLYILACDPAYFRYVFYIFPSPYLPSLTIPRSIMRHGRLGSLHCTLWS